jgi:Tfp pilus assembly protein PilV
MKKTNGPPGFALLELLIASTLAIIYITGIIQAVTFSLEVSRRCQARNASTEAAASALEILKSRPFEHPSLSERTWSDQIDSPLPVDLYRKFQIVALSPSLKRIEIECSLPAWKSYPVRMAVLVSEEMGF